VAVWPRTARAQQAAMPVVAFLDAAPLETEVRGLAEFRKGLSEIGYVEGQNVMIEYRSATTDFALEPDVGFGVLRTSC
jgi:putative tryptophan/tyrosine transport system substrate-binding protein